MVDLNLDLKKINLKKLLKKYINYTQNIKKNRERI